MIELVKVSDSQDISGRFRVGHRRCRAAKDLPRKLVDQIVDWCARYDEHDLRMSKNNFESLRTPALSAASKDLRQSVERALRREEDFGLLQKRSRDGHSKSLDFWGKSDARLFSLTNYSGPEVRDFQNDLVRLSSKPTVLRPKLTLRHFLPAFPSEQRGQHSLLLGLFSTHQARLKAFIESGPPMSSAAQKRFFAFALSAADISKIVSSEKKNHGYVEVSAARKCQYFMPSSLKTELYSSVLAYWLAIADEDPQTHLSSMISAHVPNGQFLLDRDPKFSHCVYDPSFYAESGGPNWSRHCCRGSSASGEYYFQLKASQWNTHDRFNASGWLRLVAAIMLEKASKNHNHLSHPLI